MATPRDIRILALQALYAIDASDGRDAGAIEHAIGEPGTAFGLLDATARGTVAAPEAEYTPAERRKAFEAASQAWASRDEADEVYATLAPTWPASRQPVVDRSILRLAWRELSLGRPAARIVVDEAIELAKAFSTEKSPAFINGLLDKALRHFEREQGDTDEAFGSPETSTAPANGAPEA